MAEPQQTDAAFRAYRQQLSQAFGEVMRQHPEWTGEQRWTAVEVTMVAWSQRIANLVEALQQSHFAGLGQEPAWEALPTYQESRTVAAQQRRILARAQERQEQARGQGLGPGRGAGLGY